MPNIVAALISAAEEIVSLLEGYTYEEDEMKRWLAEPDSCEICDDNEAEGWIDQDDVFPSGDDEPPAHPNCKCEVEYKTRRHRVYD